MKFVGIAEIAEKWKITNRRVRKLCKEGRVAGAYKTGATWLVPLDAKKPVDNRLKSDLIGIKNINFRDIEKLNTELNSFRPFRENQLGMLKEDLILNWTYNSNAIEGNTLTLKETKVALEGITIGGKSVTEHLEAINHKEAILFLDDLINNKEKLSEMTIKNIHYLVLKEIDNKNAGKYREENVIIAGAEHRPPSYILVPEEMGKLIYKYNNEWDNYHPVIKASLLHGEFVKIHPFIDGNGRTARLLLNFSLMISGYIPLIIKKEIRLNYYDSLDKAHTTKNYSDFIELVNESLKEAINHWLEIVG